MDSVADASSRASAAAAKATLLLWNASCASRGRQGDRLKESFPDSEDLPQGREELMLLSQILYEKEFHEIRNSAAHQPSRASQGSPREHRVECCHRSIFCREL